MSEDVQQAAGGKIKKVEIAHPKQDESNSPRKSKRRISFRLSRKNRRSREEGEFQEDGRRLSKFARQDSVLIKVKPGQTFTPHAAIFVVSVQKCDPKLGTLGVLRHHIQTGTNAQVSFFIQETRGLGIL